MFHFKGGTTEHINIKNILIIEEDHSTRKSFLLLALYAEREKKNIFFYKYVEFFLYQGLHFEAHFKENALESSFQETCSRR